MRTPAPGERRTPPPPAEHGGRSAACMHAEPACHLRARASVALLGVVRSRPTAAAAVCGPTLLEAHPRVTPACRPPVADNQVSANMVGTVLAFALSFITTMFYFGLYEAGKLMESPVATTAELIPLDTLSFALSVSRHPDH